MFCVSCGNKISDKAQFCPFCGFKTPGTNSQTQAIQAEATTSQGDLHNTGSVSTNDNLSADSLKAAVDSTRKRSHRRMPLILVVALALALATSAAFATYYVYTNVWLPSQTQNEETAASEPAEYSIESTTVNVSVPTDPLYNPEGRDTAEWSYELISCTQQSDAVDKINNTIKESFESSVKLIESTESNIDDPNILGCVLSRNIKITYIDGSIVCLQDKCYVTAWGTHGWTEDAGVAYSLETGDPVDMASLFDMNENELISATETAFVSWLSSHPNEHNVANYSEATEYVIANIEDKLDGSYQTLLEGSIPFYIDENGLAYMTATYELGGYANGTRSIYVAAFEDNSIIGATADDTQ